MPIHDVLASVFEANINSHVLVRMLLLYRNNSGCGIRSALYLLYPLFIQRNHVARSVVAVENGEDLA